jgi:hypothetical protein
VGRSGLLRVKHGDAGSGHSGECTPRPITKENLEQLDETGEQILARSAGAR